MSPIYESNSCSRDYADAFITYHTVLSVFEKNGYNCFVEKANTETGLLNKLNKCSTDYWLSTNQEILFQFDWQNDRFSFEKIGDDVMRIDSLFQELFRNIHEEIVLKAATIFFSDVFGIYSNATIAFIAKNNIEFEKSAKLIKGGEGDLYLKAGIGGESGNIVFHNDPQDAQIIMLNHNSTVHLYHNSVENNNCSHKYQCANEFEKYVYPNTSYKSYMLVYSKEDLKDIAYAPYRNYALARNIVYNQNDCYDAPVISPQSQLYNNTGAFTGNLDGNGFSISNLCIESVNLQCVGFFNIVIGQPNKPVTIQNIVFKNTKIVGSVYVGGLAGVAKYTNVENVFFEGLNVTGLSIVGGVFGSAIDVCINKIKISDQNIHSETKYYGEIIGTVAGKSCIDSGIDCSLHQCYGYSNFSGESV